MKSAASVTSFMYAPPQLMPSDPSFSSYWKARPVVAGSKGGDTLVARP